jgi:hypothetical protein
MSIVGKLVAARHVDGRVTKGWTADFTPSCTFFHVRQPDEKDLRIETKDLKAVFFIKTVKGDPDHEEVKEFQTRSLSDREVWIEFTDGEQLAGWSAALGGETGFYFTPTDAYSNMLCAFAFRSAVQSVLQGDDAVRAAEEYRANHPNSRASHAGWLDDAE